MMTMPPGILTTSPLCLTWCFNVFTSLCPDTAVAIPVQAVEENKSTIKAVREKQKEEENNNQSLYSHHPVCCSKHKTSNQHVRPRGKTSCLANGRIETEAKNRDATVLLLKKQQSYDEQCSLSMSTIPASSSSSYQTLLKPRHP